MKKIINGKIYNTETATMVGRYDNELGWNDIFHVDEELFRKRTGEYFIHGIGGPATKYSVSTGNNSWAGGEKIIPIDYSSAVEWAEEHIPTEEFEKEFGSPIEDESRTIMTITMAASVADKARKEASKAGMSISGYIENLIK